MDIERASDLLCSYRTTEKSIVIEKDCSEKNTSEQPVTLILSDLLISYFRKYSVDVTLQYIPLTALTKA